MMSISYLQIWCVKLPSNQQFHRTLLARITNFTLFYKQQGKEGDGGPMAIYEGVPSLPYNAESKCRKGNHIIKI